MTVHEGNVLAVLRSLLPKHRVEVAAYRAKRERVPEGDVLPTMSHFPMLLRLRRRKDDGR
ncbi:hypothetical protein [Alicyclobacillus sp. SP_1]|jgi:hypothetical protein|uniref:hypothetical protein n=1 Tax=Alicyclobacillus sp. SP_1 TaxID=2942475 RepID=UPI002157C629|nr:hypothetical protein [Alicyclobacillus sp. SP_1]